MYEKILVPLDGSKVGEAALTYIEDLVSKLSPGVKVEITLLQAIQLARPPVVGNVEVAYVAHTEKEMEQTEKKAVEYLNQTGEALKSKGATVKARVEVGDATEQIIKVAEEINANMIAMSTHGRTGLSRWAFGSVTDKVLRREGRIPILLVRAPR